MARGLRRPRWARRRVSLERFSQSGHYRDLDKNWLQIDVGCFNSYHPHAGWFDPLSNWTEPSRILAKPESEPLVEALLPSLRVFELLPFSSCPHPLPLSCQSICALSPSLRVVWGEYPSVDFALDISAQVFLASPGGASLCSSFAV